MAHGIGRRSRPLRATDGVADAGTRHRVRALLLAPIILDLSPGVETSIFALDWFIWAAFALEYGIRFFLAPRKWDFARSNLIDLLVVVLPFLRPLRLARTARLLRLVGLVRTGVMLARGGKALRVVLTKHRLNYALLIGGVSLVVGSLLVWELERGSPDANIATVPDALWWGITTITTVGYGDRFPTTASGRAVGAILMILGIAFFGLVAASLSSFMVGRDRATETDPQLTEIAERLSRIEEALGLGALEEVHDSRGTSEG